MKGNPKFSMAGKQSRKYSTDVPGPGNYSSNRKARDGPSYTFGHSFSRDDMKRNKLTQQLYNQKSTLSNKGGHIGQRYRPSKKDWVPGPGAYTNVSPPKTGQETSFGHEKKLINSSARESNFIPGPGKYDNVPKKKEGSGFTFGHPRLKEKVN
jgi:hypothetical protein